MNLAAILLAFVYEPIAEGLYVTVALIWLIPDRRFEPKAGRETARPSL